MSAPKTHLLPGEKIDFAKVKSKKGAPPVPPKKWDGMCPAGKHGADFKGQTCDACAEEDAAAEMAQNAATVLEASKLRASLTVDEAEEVRAALVEARHMLELVTQTLMGGGCGALHPATKVGYALTRAEALVSNAMRQAK